MLEDNKQPLADPHTKFRSNIRFRGPPPYYLQAYGNALPLHVDEISAPHLLVVRWLRFTLFGR